MTPHDAIRKSLAKAAKRAEKADRKRRKAEARARVPARVRRIVELERQVKKSTSDAERSSYGSMLLQEKLAAAAELEAARRTELRAQADATAHLVDSAARNPRAQVASAYDDSYTPLWPVRSETELPSQTRSTKITELEDELRDVRKSGDGLAIQRVAEDLTFERLRRAHIEGRI